MSDVTLVDGVYRCELDPKSEYYDYFSHSKNCEQYPHCLCEDACGPFTQDRYAYEVFEHRIKEMSVIGPMYTVLANYSYAGWSCVVALLVGLQFRGNAMSVNKVLTPRYCCTGTPS